MTVVATQPYLCTGCRRTLDQCTCVHPPGFYNLDPQPSWSSWPSDWDSVNGDQPDDESDWNPHDLAAIATAIRNGTYTPIVPTILPVEDALPLIYPSRINSFFGEAGSFKTFLALAALNHVTADKGRVLLIDYEDTPAGITERLTLNLNLTDQQIGLVDYRNPATGIGAGIDHIHTNLEQHTYQLVIVDSTGEAMATAGTNPNADEEVALWFRRLKQYARLPGAPAIIILDHIPKDKDAPAGYAIGSQRKRAAITGASYRVDTLKEPAKGRDGKIRLTVAKDRLGNRAKNTTAAIVDITTTDTGTVELRFHLSDAQIAAEHGQKWRPTIYMERISDWLHFNPASSKRDILRGATGKDEVLVLALETLVDEGWVAVDNGPRGAHLHTNTRRFSAAADPQNPDPATVLPTAAHRTPAYGGDDPATVGPPPTRGGHGAVAG